MYRSLQFKCSFLLLLQNYSYCLQKLFADVHTVTSVIFISALTIQEKTTMDARRVKGKASALDGAYNDFWDECHSIDSDGSTHHHHETDFKTKDTDTLGLYVFLVSCGFFSTT